MKKDNFLTLQLSLQGLKKTREYWQTESYEDRDRYIVDCYKSANGALPYKNLHYLREMTFSVGENVTLDALVKLAARIRQVFVIDCFQISIDRTAGEAHMLFDFMNKETLTVIQINQSSFINLEVFIIKRLGLPIPKHLCEQWSYHSLRCTKIENSNAFRSLLSECSHLKLNKYHYGILKDLIDFTDTRIGGITERLKKIK